MHIPVVRLSPDAVLPEVAHEGDAGWDLVSVGNYMLPCRGGRALVSTGMAIAIPVGYAGFILPRSGLALKHGVTCINAPGLIDAGYRGEIRVALVNLDPDADYEIRLGDRVAQLVVMAVERMEFELRTELPESTRGSGGFGSSGR